MSGHTLFLSSPVALSLPFVLLPRGSVSLEAPLAAFSHFYSRLLACRREGREADVP